MADDRPIGIFDSGVGGLTVARAIIDLLPAEHIVYVGDTARSPYGARPLTEIRSFAREIASFLLARDVKMLVVACNSVEVAAIEDLTHEARTAVVGVVDPGVRAALRATRNRRVGVIGTEATIASGAYERAVERERANVELVSQACPSFVPFVERGDTTSEELLAKAREYLSPLVEADIDTLILGCTHYPLLSGLLSLVMGPDVVLISSAEETAKDVYRALVVGDLRREPDGPPLRDFLCTGDPATFLALGGRFLGPEVADVLPARVEPVEVGGGGSEARWS